MHGLTQNSNESFNATIRERASKSIYCGREVLELTVYDDVANYHYGRRATLYIFELLNMKPANHTTPAAKHRRKIIRGLKKKKSDQQASSEGVSYEPGGDERISTIYCFIYHCWGGGGGGGVGGCFHIS